MNILVIDTSSMFCSLAVKYNEERIYKTLNEGKTHSETLLPLINDVLTKKNISLDKIDILGVVTGPGSFTGIRIGISTIKAIALAKDIPVIEVDSTEVLARNIVLDDINKVGIIDAKNDQIYGGIYSNDFKLLNEFAGSIIDFLEIIINTNKENIKKIDKPLDYAFSGSGIKHKELIKNTLEQENLNPVFVKEINQNIKKVLEIVEEKVKNKCNIIDARMLTPNYLKPSNAERKVKF